MAHATLWSNDNNGFIRQLRSFLKDAPRVNRGAGNNHDDILNLGVDYTLAASGARPAGDIMHIAPEVGCPRSTYRATCVVGTAAGGAYQAEINDTVTFNTAARTITSDAGNDWSTAGVVAGDLIRIENAATAGNNGVFRVLSITNGGATNDVITLNTLDSLAASDAADAIDVTPITGGSIFDVREDQPGGNNHIGWLTDDVEFMAKDGTIWLQLRSGGSWAVNDYAEFTLERGSFSLHDALAVERTVDLNENGASADTITRTDYGGNFIADGFVNGELVEVSGSAGEDGVYTITGLTAKTITINIGDFTASELGVTVTLTPRKSVTVNFDDADAGFSNKPTIIRTAGSWIDDGFSPGGIIEIADAASGANNGYFEIESIDTETVTNDVLVLVDAVVDDTSDVITVTPRNSILQKWDEHRYIWGASSGSPNTLQTLDSGELPPIPNSDGNYTSEWIGIGPGNDPINNPQTIYCGWQTEFSGTTAQNVEMRVFDAVSDSSFGSLGNASEPVYMYLTLSPSMETFMVADGETVTGFLDVNTSVTEWFYLGFGRVHGTQNQHPRPMFLGGAAWSGSFNRASSGIEIEFFVSGYAESGTLSSSDPKTRSSCWHRWVDGQYFAVHNVVSSQGVQTSAPGDTTVEMFTLPYVGVPDTGNPGPNVSISHAEGAQEFTPSTGTALNNPNNMYAFVNAMRPTPTTVTPNPNRQYPLLPITVLMKNPDENVVADFKFVYYIPGNGQATKNRIKQGGYTYIVGQNHEKTGQHDFAALRMD